MQALSRGDTTLRLTPLLRKLHTSRAFVPFASRRGPSFSLQLYAPRITINVSGEMSADEPCLPATRTFVLRRVSDDGMYRFESQEMADASIGWPVSPKDTAALRQVGWLIGPSRSVRVDVTIQISRRLVMASSGAVQETPSAARVRDLLLREALARGFYQVELALERAYRERSGETSHFRIDERQFVEHVMRELGDCKEPERSVP